MSLYFLLRGEEGTPGKEPERNDTQRQERPTPRLQNGGFHVSLAEQFSTDFEEINEGNDSSGSWGWILDDVRMRLGGGSD